MWTRTLLCKHGDIYKEMWVEEEEEEQDKHGSLHRTSSHGHLETSATGTEHISTDTLHCDTIRYI